MLGVVDPLASGPSTGEFLLLVLVVQPVKAVKLAILILTLEPVSDQTWSSLGEGVKTVKCILENFKV